MGLRWSDSYGFTGASRSQRGGAGAESSPHARSSNASDSWRTWLLTGATGAPTDKRRVRGANRGLKKILVEGMTNGGEHLRPWRNFSGAMVRQAVNEAMNTLPTEHKQVVKLAYFGGLSNREIAQQLGLSIGGVQRRLRQALARVSDHIEHGRSIGRRAMYGILLWLPARWLGRASGAPFHPPTGMVRAAALMAAGVAAAATISMHSAAPAHPGGGKSTTVPPATKVQSALLQAPAVHVPAVPGKAPSVGVPQLPATHLPDISLPAPPKLPKLPLPPPLS
jgi:RNA polymerase sigma factor (sigma-70 family)